MVQRMARYMYYCHFPMWMIPFRSTKQVQSRSLQYTNNPVVENDVYGRLLTSIIVGVITKRFSLASTSLSFFLFI